MGKKKKSTKVMEWINNHKKRLSLGIVLVYMIVLFVFGYINREDVALLENLYYVSQILVGLFATVGTVVAIIQYTFNSNIARQDAEKQKIVEAAKMANEFRKTVIPLMNKLAIAYSDDELNKKVIKYLEQADLQKFNKSELEKLFPNESYIKYRVGLGYHYASEVYPHFQDKAKELLLLEKNGSTDQAENVRKEVYNMVRDAALEVSGYCTELSNTLEYLSICFNTNIADEKTVYQSLHKSYFQAVHMIYIFTFESNENERDRLYYNTSSLYKKWMTIYKKKEREEEEAENKINADIDRMKNFYKENIAVKTEGI